MGDLALNIAATGIAVQQVGMDTVAQNLANANTPGYVRESPDIVTNPGGDAAGIGDGARVATITQAGNALLFTNVQQTQAALSQSTALQQVLSGVQAAFPEPSQSGLAAQLAGFWQAWDAIAQNPSALAPRTEVVDLAQNLATSFNQAATALTNLQDNAATQLSQTVSQANTLLSEIAQLNVQVTATEGAGAPAGALIDQRNTLVQQLAQATGAVARPMPDGTVTVAVGGITLVQGSFADTLQVTGNAGATEVRATTSGVALPASGGTVAGLLAAVNQYLPAYQAQLDTAANALASTVNGQLALGYTAAGTSGASLPLFIGTGAAGLAVNPQLVADPQQIAASATATLPDATNDGANAQAMAELSNSVTGPDQAYRSLIQGMGAQLQAVNNQVQAQTSVANAAQQNLQAAAGVSPDQEMVAMLAYQQAYEASAKVVSAAQAAVQALLAAT